MIGIKGDQGKNRGFPLMLLILLVLVLVAVVVVGQQLFPPVEVPAANISIAGAEVLATLNGRALDDYGRGYLPENDYFSHLEYVPVPSEGLPLRMTIGNQQDDLKGVLMHGKRFAVQVMACDWQDHVCGFRVNGVPTGPMKPRPETAGGDAEFLLDRDYKLVLNHVDFDYCDHRRFCNIHFEAYDIVNMEIQRR